MSGLFLVDDPFCDYPKNLSLFGSRALAEEYVEIVDRKNQAHHGSRIEKPSIIEIALQTERVHYEVVGQAMEALT